MAKNPAGGTAPKKKPFGGKAGPGRPPGMQNKVTGEFRETVRLLLEKNSKNVSKWLDQVAKTDPSKALDHIAKLAEYASPKMTRTEMSGPNGSAIPTSVTITHVKPGS